MRITIVILILVITGVFGINISFKYNITANEANQYANLPAPPKTGIPERREVGLTDLSLDFGKSS
ncbi:MAG: hypothetical protein IGS39_01795 [Calothrix sp. C42_A2020_038]|nr:hypothetical protein [Calothrix sp. C42_A2020_038]